MLQIGTKIYAGHQYIIAQKSKSLEMLMGSHSVESPIEITNIDPLIFYQILLYIYTGKCDLLVIGECPENLKNLVRRKGKDKVIEEKDNFENNDNYIIDECTTAFEYYKNKKNTNDDKKNKQKVMPSDPVRLLHEAAKRFDLKHLCKMLDSLVYENGFVQKKSGKPNHASERLFFHRSFKKMHDVVIKTVDGKEILGHKCILSARLEYFNNIFAVRWNMVRYYYFLQSKFCDL